MGKHPVMNAQPLLAMLSIAAGGALVAMQAPINAALSRQVGGSLLAATISFGVGFAALATLAALGGSGSVFALRGAAPWMWLGGLFGAFYVACMIWALPMVGVVTAVSLLILGQLLTALLLDSIGAFGMEPRPIEARRLLGVALVLIGAALSRKW